ncbi:MAG TPA: signal peptidase I [Steroidobacteraceae bacterium]|nr:signal peptidase I [Steroidobacteraceae bacterium]
MTLEKMRAWWRNYRGTLLFLCLMLGFRSAWADWVTVPTGSMNPTILEGDRVLVDKHVFGLRIPFTRVQVTAGDDPVRGDIVVFDSPVDGTSLVKRVIGVPGDVVALEGDRLTVNGRAARYAVRDIRSVRGLLAATAAEHPLVLREAGLGRTHDVMILPDRLARRSLDAVVVPEGMYFMMGDNRDNSADSRYFGFVPRRDIVGRATRVIVSLNPDRHYAPRSGRFLLPLS